MKYEWNSISWIGKLLLIMYLITALLLFVLAFLTKQLEWSEPVIGIGIMVTEVIACGIGGFLAGKIQGTKKFLWGILLGLMYVVLMLLITFFVKKGFSASTQTFVRTLIFCIGGGMIGGMIS